MAEFCSNILSRKMSKFVSLWTQRLGTHGSPGAKSERFTRLKIQSIIIDVLSFKNCHEFLFYNGIEYSLQV